MACRGGLTGMLVLVALACAPAAWGTSLIVSGNSAFERDIDVHATSGPAGESPWGRAFFVESIPGLGDLQIGSLTSDNVTCMAVRPFMDRGKIAVVGLRAEIPPALGQVFVAAGYAEPGSSGFFATAQIDRDPEDCSLFSPVRASLMTDGFVALDELSLPPSLPGRMVGKGRITGSGRSVSYAYVVNCKPTGSTHAPFEVRFDDGGRFRLQSIAAVTCGDDPAVSTPAAGFDTQTGSGIGILDGVGWASVRWTFVDGGPGGANDSASLSLSRVGFVGPELKPPLSFPGSDQATGLNTARPVPPR